MVVQVGGDGSRGGARVVVVRWRRKKNAKLTLQKQHPQGWTGCYWWETGPSLRGILGPGCTGLGESTLSF